MAHHFKKKHNLQKKIEDKIIPAPTRHTHFYGLPTYTYFLSHPVLLRRQSGAKPADTFGEVPGCTEASEVPVEFKYLQPGYETNKHTRWLFTWKY